LHTDFPTATGFCPRCNTTHRLTAGHSYQYGQKLLEQISKSGTIELVNTGREPDSQLKTDFLFGKARGKMFGVLECEAASGGTIYLHAFSGQYNDLWLVNGWVGPLFDVQQWQDTNYMTEKEIKRLTRQINHSRQSAVIAPLKKIRKQLSRKLMKEIHRLYAIQNFLGKTATLSQLFPRGNIPTGTGDCCGPKLLNHAAKHNLRPLSMVEFYIGRENRSSTKHHGHFYSSCLEKCEPLLGFMLCGVKECHDTG